MQSGAAAGAGLNPFSAEIFTRRLRRSLPTLQVERLGRRAWAYGLTHAAFQEPRQRHPRLASAGGTALIDDLETLVAVEAESEKAERAMELGVVSHERLVGATTAITMPLTVNNAGAG
jgi:hypothetical protein